ncbi:MAG TPA: tetratricopeptide repeat protein [Myxococcota bacterium]|nr:tetratricopeptide repeat protein [Myxococcota bacterium]
MGDLTIDLGRQEVRCGTDEIPLPKLSFDLLVALVRAAPNLASLDRLMGEVWPDVVVSPETVSQRVKLLRTSLGDDARKPRYIVGLRGRGYRLVPPVVALLPESEPSAAAPSPSRRPPLAVAEPAPAAASPSPRRQLRARSVVLASVALVGALGGVAALLQRASVAPTVGPSGEPRSVAVLPFESLSADPSDQFLAPGIAEMVQHRLASRSDLVVIASTSSFAIRERESDLREIGRRLGARYLVDGSVLRVGDRLRVTAQIVDAESAKQLSALRFDRELADLIAVEDEIAAGVADALALALDPAAASTPRRGENLDAHLAYLQGHRLLSRYRVADAKAAIAKFEEAVTLEPRNAEAVLGLALAHLRHGWLAAEDDRSTWENARPLVERALALDPSLGEAVVLLADNEGGEAEFRRGLALAPNLGRGYELFANFLWQRGKLAEALQTAAYARRIDPLTARNHHLEASFLLSLGRIPEAEERYAQALEIDPEFHATIARLAKIDAWQGRYAQAIKRIEQALAIDPDALWIREAAAGMYLALGDVAAAIDVAGERDSVASVEIALYQRQYDRAAQLTAGLSRDQRRHSTGRAALSRAVRDAGLHSGVPDAALVALEAIGVPDELADPFPDFDKLIARAHLLARSGREALASELLEIIHARLERPEETRYNPFDALRIRASALGITGDRDGAIEALAKWAEPNPAHAWYPLERDPAFDAIRTTPRFQTLIARYHAHAASERSTLEELRARGEVPKRPAR